MRKAISALTVLVLFPVVSVLAQEEVIDQQQTGINAGFFFEDTVIRWQEFMPTLDNLSAIEINVLRQGDPGNILAEIRTLDDTLLGQEIIAEADVPSAWLKITFSEVVSLEPGHKYRIYIYTDQDSPNPDNRYFWKGSDNSLYNPACSCDVQSAWPNYDYAFKTYGYLPVSVDEELRATPCNISLSQNYPNPFNASTTISYELSNQDYVTLVVYDILGREVQTLVEGFHDAGSHVINFDAKNLPSGIYFYKLQTGNSSLQTKKMLLIR